MLMGRIMGRVYIKFDPILNDDVEVVEEDGVVVVDDVEVHDGVAHGEVAHDEVAHDEVAHDVEAHGEVVENYVAEVKMVEDDHLLDQGEVDFFH
jgi:hypothetical protein